jgi:hypothetical protein
MSNWCDPWRNVTPPPLPTSSSSARRGRWIQSVQYHVFTMRTAPSSPLAMIARVRRIGRS